MHFHRDRGFAPSRSSEITPQRVYLQRREWLRQLAAGGAGAAMAMWAGRSALAQGGFGKRPQPGSKSPVSGAQTMEKPTS
jgi:sulfoxide reductase catalytic subunit YedY